MKKFNLEEYLKNPNRKIVHAMVVRQEQTTIDWEQRRYEIAKDILAAWYSNSDRIMRQGTPQSCSAEAVKVADALIEELQK